MIQVIVKIIILCTHVSQILKCLFRTRKMAVSVIDRYTRWSLFYSTLELQFQTWVCPIWPDPQTSKSVSAEMVWRRFHHWVSYSCSSGPRNIPRFLVEFCSLSPARRCRRRWSLAGIHSRREEMCLGSWGELGTGDMTWRWERWRSGRSR